MIDAVRARAGNGITQSPEELPPPFTLLGGPSVAVSGDAEAPVSGSPRSAGKFGVSPGEFVYCAGVEEPSLT